MGIEWSPSVSVGVPQLDNEHKQLFDMINQLEDAMRSGKSKDVCGEIVRGLLAYTRTHFADEERYLAKMQYPDLPIQQREHAEFIRKVEEFQRDLAASHSCLSVKMMGFLSTWLFQHIKAKDLRYAEHCRTIHAC